MPASYKDRRPLQLQHSTPSRSSSRAISTPLTVEAFLLSIITTRCRVAQTA
jgi:hypothetical protein